MLTTFLEYRLPTSCNLYRLHGVTDLKYYPFLSIDRYKRTLFEKILSFYCIPFTLVHLLMTQLPKYILFLFPNRRFVSRHSPPLILSALSRSRVNLGSLHSHTANNIPSYSPRTNKYTETRASSVVRPTEFLMATSTFASHERCSALG
jgi:hypothetical protein